ncbi:MAG: M48 family metallopeptidase [Clostridia bacterium]|nr:M48 family metallopeptidase [Clostridia bacterium]
MEINIIREKRRSFELRVTDGTPVLRVPKKTTDAEAEEFLRKHRRWIENRISSYEKQKEIEASAEPLTVEELREIAGKAAVYIPERVGYFAGVMGLKYGRITIRRQKTKWGSCSSKGNLNFNCLLMLAPPEVIDSIVVHELCHLRYLDHGSGFRSMVLKYCPDYDDTEKWLKENGRALIARLPAEVGRS